MSTLLALHDMGDEAAGAPWRAAFGDWPGTVLAPDLPGHAGTPPPVGGCYELTDAVLFALRTFRDATVEVADLIVGVGINGWAAQMLALGGRARGLVLVDGIGGPWRTPRESIAAGVAYLRAVADDPAALASPPPHGLDPRLRHGMGGQSSASFALKLAEAMPVPTLVVETPRSGLTRDERAPVVAAFTSEVRVVDLPDRDPRDVAAAVIEWSSAVASR